jgi:hypothetical protein
MSDNSESYRARIYLPSSVPCFNSVVSLGDPKVIRARLAHLINLGFEYEQMQLGMNAEVKVTAPETIIKSKKNSSPTTMLPKDKASKTSEVVQDEHLKEAQKTIPYKVPDSFLDQTFSFS